MISCHKVHITIAMLGRYECHWDFVDDSVRTFAMRRYILLAIVFHFILCMGYVEPKEKFARKDTKGLENEPISEEKLASLPNEIIKDATPTEPEVELQDDTILEQSSLELPLEKVEQHHNAKLESLDNGTKGKGTKEKNNTVDRKDPMATKELDLSDTKESRQYVKKGHILFFHNAGTRSHLIALNALAEGLVEHGHRVTSVQYMKSNINHENYTEVLIQDK